MNETKYMNPYLAGFFLGLILLATIYITGRGLGASGAVKSAVIAVTEIAAPAHTASQEFYKEYLTEHDNNPLKNWLVFEVVGVLIGAFISGLISNRLTFKILLLQHSADFCLLLAHSLEEAVQAALL
jgi:hypothetical protein